MRLRFGVIGLGRMGGHLALQAIEKGHEVVGYNRSRDDTERLAQKGLTPAFTYDELVEKLGEDAIILTYVPHKAEGDVLRELADRLAPESIVIDGGNSHWRDSVRRHGELRERGIGFLDAGTSGGVAGARRGACFMVGGDPEVFERAEGVFRALSVPEGYLHVGPPGSGHFVKLVHNAVEFAMVQALAEGAELIERSEYGKEVELADVARVWSHGSVIRGWLVELFEDALRSHPGFEEKLSSLVEDTKEGKWFVNYALEREVAIPTLALAELMFYRYRDPEARQAKFVALLRHAYGGHPLPWRAEQPPYERREADELTP